MGYVPKRGDVIWIDFDPQRGREISGTRPALVLSADGYNVKTGLCVLCAITSKIKGYPFEVHIPDSMDIEGVILADQVRTMDWRERKIRFASSAPSAVITDVLAKLTTLLN
jgi:mRNA interferase MazF